MLSLKLGQIWQFLNESSCNVRILGSVLLLLFRHSDKNSITQEERQATSPKLVTGFHLPHAIEMRLHVRKINAAILIPETVGSVSV